MLHYKKMKSPVGELTLVANEKSLVAVLWEQEKENRVRLDALEKSENHPILKLAEKQLQEYFRGERMIFELPLEMNGTEFQKKVWRALQKIPFGESRSYGELARAIGRPTASRAVGAANGKNPLSIVVPCHRVVGANGSLTGFAGGLKSKRYLLDFESQT